jgi:hypothetical protein
MAFVAWMSNPAGRILRIVAGLILIGVGLYFQGFWGYVVAIVGAVPILAGVFNFCLIGPLLGGSFRAPSPA